MELEISGMRIFAFILVIHFPPYRLPARPIHLTEHAVKCIFKSHTDIQEFVQSHVDTRDISRTFICGILEGAERFCLSD